MSSCKLLTACRLLCLSWLFAYVGFADTINSLQSSSFGSPVDLSELAGLGLDPGSFLFSQNTMYDFTGNEELSIVSAQVNPADTQSLVGIPVQVTDVTLGDTGDTPELDTTNGFGVPEPKTILLSVVAFGGLIAFGITRLRRDQARGRTG